VEWIFQIFLFNSLFMLSLYYLRPNFFEVFLSKFNHFWFFSWLELTIPWIKLNLLFIFLEKRMAKNIFSRFLSWFMKPIHIELSDKTINVPMPKIFGQYNLLKLFNVFNCKLFPIAWPFNHRWILFILNKYWLKNTLIISKAFWTKLATED